MVAVSHSWGVKRRGSWSALAFALLLTLGATVVLVAPDRPQHGRTDNLIDGPYARLLAESADLGPAHTERVQLTAALIVASRSSSPG